MGLPREGARLPGGRQTLCPSSHPDGNTETRAIGGHMWLRAGWAPSLVTCATPSCQGLRVKPLGTGVPSVLRGDLPCGQAAGGLQLLSLSSSVFCLLACGKSEPPQQQLPLGQATVF